jgi:hypothetical protein
LNTFPDSFPNLFVANLHKSKFQNEAMLTDGLLMSSFCAAENVNASLSAHCGNSSLIPIFSRSGNLMYVLELINQK